MLNFPNSRVALSREAKVAPGAQFIAEGQAAVYTKGAMTQGVQPATGTDTDIFAGLVIASSSASPYAEPYANKVEHLVVGPAGVLSLARAPVAGQLFIYDETTKAAVATAGLTIDGNDISGTGIDAGSEYRVVYKFALTVIERTALQGDVSPGGPAGLQVSQIGLFERGLVGTSEFDASKNWETATAVKLAANGQLTDQTGSGIEVNAVIERAPTLDYPFLLIHFDTAV